MSPTFHLVEGIRDQEENEADVQREVEMRGGKKINFPGFPTDIQSSVPVYAQVQAWVLWKSSVS